MKYAFGAYGTNNLGDDAIFEGMCQKLGPVKQIYINKPSVPSSVWYADLLLGNESFDPGAEELIIGGGGLFHCKDAIIDYIRMTDLAIQSGMSVSIQGLGTEGMTSEYEEEVKLLCKRCQFVSVRSRQSQRILQRLGIISTVHKDFAYNLKSDASTNIALVEFDNDLPIIGLVTGGNADGEAIKKIAEVINLCTIDEISCNFLHIPHSKSYTNSFNNDCVTGEILWSSVEIYHSNRENQYKTFRFVKSPQELLSVYIQLDAVIGARYHSFIFSEITNKPMLGLVSGSKSKAYFEERPELNNIDFDLSVEEILYAVRQLIIRVL